MGQTNRTQRELMRDLFIKYRDDHKKICEEYAVAYHQGLVAYKSNRNKIPVEKYAKFLCYDGIKRGWLRQTDVHPVA